MPSPAAPLPPPLALAPARAATCKCKQRDEREPQLYIKCMWRRCADISLRVGLPTTRSPRAHFHAMILFLQQSSPFRSPFRRGGRERGHPSGNPAAKQLLAESAPSSIPIPPSFLPPSIPPTRSMFHLALPNRDRSMLLLFLRLRFGDSTDHQDRFPRNRIRAQRMRK